MKTDLKNKAVDPDNKQDVNKPEDILQTGNTLPGIEKLKKSFSGSLKAMLFAATFASCSPDQAETITAPEPEPEKDKATITKKVDPPTREPLRVETFDKSKLKLVPKHSIPKSKGPFYSDYPRPEPIPAEKLDKEIEILTGQSKRPPLPAEILFKSATQETRAKMNGKDPTPLESSAAAADAMRENLSDTGKKLWDIGPENLTPEQRQELLREIAKSPKP